MRQHLSFALTLAVASSFAWAQPCTPQLLQVGGTTMCGSQGRVDALAVSERDGVPRLFGLVRNSPNDVTESLRASGLGMWTPQGWQWQQTLYWGVHRTSSLLSVPRTESLGPRLYVVGYPLPGSSDTAPPTMEYFEDGYWRWRGCDLDYGINHADVPPALVYRPGPSERDLLIGGSFRSWPDQDHLLLSCWNVFCEPDLPPLGGLPNSVVRAMAYYAPEDGAEPVLYAGGTDLNAGGSILARLVGETWEHLPIETAGPVTALKAHAGSLWATTPRGLLRYDGNTFEALPTLEGIECIEWFDDGTGEQLYAGGSFSNAAGAPANQVAMYDGVAWQPVGPGFNDSEVQPVVKSFVIFDFGEGPRLVAGGHFQRMGVKLLNNLAQWDGHSWRATGDSDSLFAATYHDDGHGHEVHMLGWSHRDVWYQPQNRVMRHRGGDLEILGDDFPEESYVYKIYSFDLGSGPQLYAVGNFSAAPGGVPAAGIASWDGEQWHALGEQLPGAVADVRGAAVYDEDGPGPMPRSLYVTGAFTGMGTTSALNVARWDGEQWHAVGAGLAHWGAQIVVRQGPGVNELVVLKNHPTPSIGGEVATWNGVQWSFGAHASLGSQVDGNIITVADIGSGPRVYSLLTSMFLNTWNGSNWATVPTSVLPMWPNSIASLDDGAGPALFVGGWLTGQGGGDAVVRWDGQAYEPIFRAERDIRNVNATFDGTRRGILITQSVFVPGAVFYRGCPVCRTSDFNNDADFGTDADILDFFACLAGNCCSTCESSDFDGDGDYGTDADIESFFRVLAGGEC